MAVINKYVNIAVPCEPDKRNRRSARISAT